MLVKVQLTIPMEISMKVTSRMVFVRAEVNITMPVTATNMTENGNKTSSTVLAKCSTMAREITMDIGRMEEDMVKVSSHIQMEINTLAGGSLEIRRELVLMCSNPLE